ncbi:MAG: glycosyltransferase [Marinagarivorans sp.]|nr:glycosyltransferase [Marinagarivorans sp.]
MAVQSVTKKSPKKIAIILPDLSVGGAERVMVRLANYWAENQNIATDIVLIRRSGALISEVSSRVNIISLAQQNRCFWVSALFGVWGLIIYMHRNKQSVFLSTLTGTNIYSLFVAYLTQSQKRITIREACATVNITSSIKRYLAKLFYRGARRVIAVSHDVKIDLAKNFLHTDKNIDVINNPIDIDAIKKMANSVKLPVVKSSVDTISIVAVGRLSYQKGFDILLNRLAALEDQITWTLTLIGEGRESPSLMAQASELGKFVIKYCFWGKWQILMRL